jgi:hypothetical protein
MTNEHHNPPNKWVQSTKTDHNITYHNPTAGKTLTVIKSRKHNWQIKGLVGYNSKEAKYPLFTENTTLEKAKEIAFDVMNNGVDDVNTEIEYVSANSNTTKSSPDNTHTTTNDSSNQNEHQQQNTNTKSSTTPEKHQKDTQQPLTNFI